MDECTPLLIDLWRPGWLHCHGADGAEGVLAVGLLYSDLCFDSHLFDRVGDTAPIFGPLG